MKNIYPNYILTPTGEGRHMRVYSVGPDQKKVIKVKKNSDGGVESNIENADVYKANFYLTKIFSFFLTEIPAIHMSGSDPVAEIRERIDLDIEQKKFEELENYRMSVDCPEKKKPHLDKYSRFVPVFLKMLGEEYGVSDIDMSPQNYSISVDGDIKYLDSIPVYTYDGKYNFDIKKIRAKIATVKNEKDKKRLEGWADRLEELSNSSHLK